jgi:hypothetical protein
MKNNPRRDDSLTKPKQYAEARRRNILVSTDYSPFDKNNNVIDESNV